MCEQITCKSMIT